jgi:hypothetical protein
MARSVSVKIPTSVVIEMIETKLATLTKAEADYPKLLSAYKKDVAEYFLDLVALADKQKKKYVDFDNDFNGNGGSNISYTTSYNGSGSIVFGKELLETLGEAPKKPENVDTWQTRQNKEQLEKTLKLLRLTEQETITSSTYNSVLDLL